LKVSLDEILGESLKTRFAKHEEISSQFKNHLAKSGLKILPVNDKVAAHGLTAVYFPEGINGADFLGKVAGKGFTIAGGIHKALVGKYFRVGHMGFSVYEGHVDKLTKAIDEALAEVGYKKQ